MSQIGIDASGLKWGLVLGGESFAERIRARLKTRRESSGRRELRPRRSWREVVRAVGAARGERWEEFAGHHGDPGLALALYVGRRCTGMTVRALGEAAGGMDYTAVSMAIKRFEQRLVTESKLRDLARRLLAENSIGAHRQTCEM